jgi:predicted ferric reductase
MTGMTGAKLGSLIGAVGGLVFILANAGALSGPWSPVLRVLGVLSFLAVVTLVLRARIIGQGVEPSRGQLRAYGFTVLAEVAAIVLGSRILVAAFDLTTATLPWVATVLGLHFLVFARIFRETVFVWLGAAVTVCGVAGVVMAVAGTAAVAISVAAGVVPGLILLLAVGQSAWVGRPVSAQIQGR